ncbi:RICIN domain-containing protein [Amycolatopsis sp. cmx-11-12]|uniref:RICIN domain-containing protein n=1 Tax=Amycolatopsis sp. cmx-11-12 TaxID=2785795 RepID=UPI003918518A
MATGTMSIPATAASQEDFATMALIQLTLTSVKDGRLLDVKDGARNDGAAIVVNKAPGSAQSWRINTGANPALGFTIVNDTTGKCLDAPRLYQQLQQQPCDGRASEKWYFQPVTGSGQKAFMIRHEADNSCLSPQTPDHSDNGVYTDECSGTPLQQWTIPADVYTKALSTAVDYAAARCTKDTSTCSWSTTTQQRPVLLPQVCVSPVWYNDTSDTIPWTFTLTTSTGWTNTVGFKLSASLQLGSDALPIKVMVAGEVHGETSLNLKEDLGNSLTVSVQARKYGWVALSELATQVTGTWTFDTQGFAWTIEDTITVPLKHDSNGGASVYHAKTRPEFTNCAA